MTEPEPSSDVNCYHVTIFVRHGMNLTVQLGSELLLEELDCAGH